jgi:hypothetical protein
MTTGERDRRYAQLREEGYCLFPQVLDRPMLEELRRVTDALLDAYSPEEAHRFRYQGSNIGIAYQHPVFPRLFTLPAALDALRLLGFPNPVFWSGFCLSKPPHAPPLYWHQDWWGWDDPISRLPTPAQVFLMYYLTDTTPENGCLRLIPGTHYRRIALHDLLPAAHTEETYEARLDTPLFSAHPDEVDVPVQAGDLVIGDARILHAAHANQTDARRTCLTLWYLPDFVNLPESIQAFAAQHRPLPPPDFVETLESRLLADMVPRYSGTVTPIAFNRIPGEHLTGSPVKEDVMMSF